MADVWDLHAITERFPGTVAARDAERILNGVRDRHRERGYVCPFCGEPLTLMRVDALPGNDWRMACCDHRLNRAERRVTTRLLARRTR